MVITIDTAKNEDYIAINHLGETVTFNVVKNGEGATSIELTV